MKNMLVVLCAFVALQAAETVTKMSATFAVPGTAVRYLRPSSAGPLFFCVKREQPGTKRIVLSWTVQGKNETGSLSVYSLAGAKIKTFILPSSTGTVDWNFKPSGTASGVYYAVLSYGPFKKSIKIML